MGWSIGYDSKWERDIGYGVPAICDHPDCNKEISRGLGYVCGGEPYGGENGCGLFFCEKHKQLEEFENDECSSVCERCAENKDRFKPTPDTTEWKNHKLTHESWKQWRDENPDEVAKLIPTGEML